uniref:HAT C-terminal dimerisation domain-containing protein n=1 Tax=Meloidogyne javanica TaxID=6303 RepID=A0A915MR05_MELJA
EKIKKDISLVEYVSLTIDCWTSKDSAHSLLGITCHFVRDGLPTFVVLSAKPIKGRHNASVLKELLNVVLSDFSIPKSKIFVVLRDAAEVMVKVCYDLGLKSIDCFAHKCNLAIWDGIRKLNDDESIKNLIERVKKFVRKLKKSRIQKEEFENLQKVRWSSTFLMIDRFILNKQVINLLSAGDLTLPNFGPDDWTTLAVLRKILQPIHSATNDLQKRNTPLSATIPLFRVICFALEDENDLLPVRQAIIDFLRAKKIPIECDPYGFWTVDNTVKWPILSKIATRFLSAPCTSAEAESIISASTTGCVKTAT